MKLSIIICLYNTDREYFDTCLKSITESTLGRGGNVPGVDYEICIVDDGSVTDYSDIIERYSAVTTLRYQKTENRGIFRARLLGIEMAEGEYLAFCDSDDSVSFNYHRPMLECMENEGADIVFNDWAFHTEGTRYTCKKDITVYGDLTAEGDEVLLNFVKCEGRLHSFYVLWNKMYRKELLKSVAQMLLPLANREERFNYSEDALMNFFAFRDAKRITNVHTGYYYYRVHNAQSVNVISAERLKSHIDCMAYTFREMSQGVGDNIYRERILSCIDGWRKMMCRTHYSYAKSGGHTELYSYIREKYGVEKLRTSTLKDASGYIGHRILALNEDGINSALYSLWETETPVTVFRPGLRGYELSSLEYMKGKGKEISLSDREGIVIPKPKISLRSIITHNPIVYYIGIVLFPKGSKIRAFLKKII